MRKFYIVALAIAMLAAALMPAGAALAATPAIRSAENMLRWDASGTRAYGQNNRLLKNEFGFDGFKYYSFDGNGLARKGWYMEGELRSGGSAFDKFDKDTLRNAACILPTPNVAKQYVCHFDEGTGAMTVGWMKLDGQWLYFDYMGRMKGYGWLQDGGKWYYMGSNNSFWGSMTTGWVSEYPHWYYMNPGGDMATGWKRVGGRWYYMQNSGRMTSSAWVKSKGEWYFMEASGAMAANKWVQHRGSWYYLKADGIMAHSCVLTIGGMDYSFDANGKWLS